jgi:ABC-type phosphate transport system substrate-binding protein
MIKFSRLLVGVASLAAAATLVAGTVTTASAAPNDPPKGVTPKAYDIVGVGSDTTEYVMDQLALGYDATIKKDSSAKPKVYSWDALPEGKNVANPAYKITPKAGCKTIERPDGSSDGITALNTTQVIKSGGKTYACINFARSSRARKATDPKLGSGGIAFVAFARDAITWSVRSTAKGGNDAPRSLNLAQLKAIFTCADTNWDEVGGKDAAVKVYLPQAGSGTLATWETFMGITTLGSCVSQAPEENEGTYAGFNSPNAIFIYSIGAYVAQKYHSAACGKTPSKTQNKFGCNLTGYLTPMPISGVQPMTSAKVPTINPKFPSGFWRTIYNVVNYTKATADHIPANVNALFGRTGYMCKNKAAQAEIRDYGFVTTALCGSVS